MTDRTPRQDEDEFDEPGEWDRDLADDGLLDEEDFRDPAEHVREDYRRIRSNRRITVTLILNAAGAFVLAALIPGIPRLVLLTVGLALGIGSIGFHRINHRCPSCRGYLGMKVTSHCGTCGMRLY